MSSTLSAIILECNKNICQSPSKLCIHIYIFKGKLYYIYIYLHKLLEIKVLFFFTYVDI